MWLKKKGSSHYGFKFLFPKSFNVRYNVFIATFHYGIILKGYESMVEVVF